MALAWHIHMLFLRAFSRRHIFQRDCKEFETGHFIHPNSIIQRYKISMCHVVYTGKHKHHVSYSAFEPGATNANGTIQLVFWARLCNKRWLHVTKDDKTWLFAKDDIFLRHIQRAVIQNMQWCTQDFHGFAKQHGFGVRVCNKQWWHVGEDDKQCLVTDYHIFAMHHERATSRKQKRTQQLQTMVVYRHVCGME